MLAMAFLHKRKQRPEHIYLAVTVQLLPMHASDLSIIQILKARRRNLNGENTSPLNQNSSTSS